ncbi:MAG: trigger factor [Bdellovibrionales bacterium]|nr:trigger factor [Bdellovibrionales bacterium]
MKSTLDTLEGLGRKLNIEVPADKVSDTFTKMYEGIQKNAEIKGFRKGKAPISAIKSKFSERVKQDVLQQLVSESYQKALEEHSLDPISQPTIDLVNFDEEGDFQFTAEMEIRPDVVLKKIEGLKVEKEKFELNEDQIEQALTNIQQNFKEFSPIFEDRPAKEGDFLKIDFDGFINNEPLEGGSAKGHTLELGSNSFIPGFEEGLLGSKVGEERTLNLTFPIDYHVEKLKGQNVEFKVKVHEISKQTLPEINDEFAQKVSPQFKTLDELKKMIREDMEKNENKRIEDDLKNRILKSLTKENPVEVPKSLKEEQKHRLIHDVEHRLQNQGVDAAGIKEYKDKWANDFEETASFMVQSSFLIDSIAQKHDLLPKSEDYEAKMKEMADEYRLDVSKIKEYYQDQSRKSAIMFQIMEEKVVKFLLDKADIVEVDKDKLKEEV